MIKSTLLKVPKNLTLIKNDSYPVFRWVHLRSSSLRSQKNEAHIICKSNLYGCNLSNYFH